MTNIIEILIEKVKEYPIIYDLSHLDYKNIRMKNKVWDEIGKEVESDGDELKKKWKNLRDSYAKHLRSEKTTTGQAAKTVDRYKTWPWAQQMSFFKSFLKFADTQSNIPNPSHCDPLHSEDLVSSDSSLAPNTTPRITTAENLITVDSQTPLRKKKRCASSSKRFSEETAQSSVDQVVTYLNSRKEEHHDDIDLVFLGYAKTIKKMSRERQVITKYRVAKIIMEEEIKDLKEKPIDTHSTQSYSQNPSPSPPDYRSSDTTSSFAESFSPHSLRQTQESYSTNLSATNWYEHFGEHTNL